MTSPVTGVVLMTYGSPSGPEDVRGYMTRIRGGRDPGDELVAEFRRRYDRIGGSPLVDITRRQAAGLERALAASGAFRAEAGMRFSAPTVEDAARTLADRGATRLLGLVLSPQYSPILMSAYPRALDTAAAEVGLPARTVGAWHTEPGFIQALASRLRAERAAAGTDATAILLTAHSLPRRVLDQEPGYVDQLRETAVLVARAAGLSEGDWTFAYQSAGHTPEEWLKPDMLDLLPELAARGFRRVLVQPVQFLADHLETLYDLDIAGQEQAAAHGLAFRRVAAPNDAPDFLHAVAGVVVNASSDWDGASTAAGTEVPA